MSDRPPVRVLLVGPPLDASGGIGRVMGYALAALPPGRATVEVLDTRGHARTPLLSAGPLAASCGTLLARGVRGSAEVAHVNISSHGSAVRKSVVVRACRAAGLPVVLHLHASSFPEFWDGLPPWARRRVRRTFELATSVLVLSDRWRDYVCEVLAVPPERVEVLPNAVPPTGFRARSRAAGEPLHVVFLGRLGRRKGVPELLGALADPRLRPRVWRATLAGDGEVQLYRARADAAGLGDRVDVVGWLAPDRVRALLARAHVLALPSRAEGMPMSVLEAFAAGVPAVSTPVGGLGEVVRDRQNGLLVAPGDVDGLVRALARLHDDEPFRSALGAEAQWSWERAYSIDRYAERLVAAWERAAGLPSPVAAHVAPARLGA